MSRMVPRRTIDALRKQVDMSIELWGIDCELYVPTNIEDVESLDIYVGPSDMEYDKYTTKVFIQWSPSTYRLKNLGVFVENELAIIVRLPSQCYDKDSTLVDVDIFKGSYLRIPLEYVPSNLQKYSEFELVDQVISKMHDAAVVKAWKAVPRRNVEPDIREAE